MKKKIDFIKIAYFIIFVIIVIGLSQVSIKRYNISFLVCFTFFINSLLSIIMIIREKKSYSLYKTYWYFSLIFFCFAPIIQYLSHKNLWKFELTNYDYIISNLLILFSNIIFILVYSYKNNKYLLKNNVQVHPENVAIKTTVLTKLILLFLLFACLMISISNIGLSNLFSTDENMYSLSTNSMFNTIFGLLCRGIPVYIFYIFYSEKSRFNIWSFIALIVIIILNFPTSITRFWMGSIYIGIFLIVFNKKNSSKRKYDIVLLAAFALIFPLLYAFKYHDINYFVENGLEVKAMNDSYNSVDYDAYSIVPRSIIYVKDNGIENGKQLLGTVLFIVPRQIWENKPNPTGDLIARAQGQSYTNISCPYISEGYINFGIVGTIIFQIVLALICAKMDYNYWYKANDKLLFRIIYPFLMGFLVYLLRGALHPVIVYLFCFSLPLLFMQFLIKKDDRNDIKSI